MSDGQFVIYYIGCIFSRG